jgi:hypothetical protein
MGLFVGGLEQFNGGGLLSLIPISNNSDLGNEIIVQDPTLLMNNTDINSFSLLQNSLLDISVNNVKYLQNFDIYSANKQSSLLVGGAGSNSFSVVGNTNGNYGERDGFVDLVPTLQFSGTSKIDITLNTPIAAYTGTDNLYLEIIFRGFLSLGASNLNK